MILENMDGPFIRTFVSVVFMLSKPVSKQLRVGQYLLKFNFHLRIVMAV